MNIERYIQCVPEFVIEGYAVFEEVDLLMPDGTTLHTITSNFIGVKPDAPQWAKDEYKEWLRVEELAKEGIF